MVQLIPIGFFRELRHSGNPQGPSLQEARRLQPGPYQAQVVDYLKQGTLLVGCLGLVRDFFVGGGPPIASPHLLTDGRHIWYRDLPYYVGHYNVKVPDEFIEYAIKNQ